MDNVTLFSLRLSAVSLICTLAGIASHLAFFIRGEKHPYVKYILFSITALPILLTLALYRLSYFFPHLSSTDPNQSRATTAAYTGIRTSGYTLYQSLLLTTTIYLSFFLGLFTSILAYRLLFHKLRCFPGPFLAKATKFWSLKEQYKSGQQWHYKLKQLHNRYGDLVRIGPNELSIRHPNVSHTIANFRKGTLYDFGYISPSLQSTRDVAIHKERRKVWDKAFTLPAIQNGYIPRIIQHAHELRDYLGKMAEEAKVVDMKDQFFYYTFDSMGDLSFGKREGFGMMKTQGQGESAYFMKATHASSKVFGYLMHISWAFRIFNLFEMLLGNIKTTKRRAFFLWSDKIIEEMKAEREKERLTEGKEAKEKPPGEKDILHYLLEAEPSAASPTNPQLVKLPGEVRLAVIAGSDTTANTFTTLFFYLASSPKHLQALQSEIDGLYASNPTFIPTHDCPVPRETVTGGTPSTLILESCITEALRLNPPVTNGIQRIVPDSGFVVADQFIPPGTLIWYPFYTNFRNPAIYVDPDTFLPERWYDPAYTSYVRSEKKTDDFVPFWIGRYGCVGKNLALANLRVVTTMLLREFDIVAAEGWGGEKGERRWYKEHRDVFTLLCGGWEARVRRRNGVKMDY